MPTSNASSSDASLVFHCATENDLTAVAQSLVQLMDHHRIFAFDGEMGAGKTTLIRHICDALEVADAVSSPTFSIVNEYRSGKGTPVYHFDFYRLNSTEEAFDLGYEDYFYGSGICLIEWPEKIQRLLPHQLVNVQIDVGEEGRTIRIIPS